MSEIKIKAPFILNILKGFYVDNYKNRKLGRVGKEYGEKVDLDLEKSTYDKFYDKEKGTWNKKREAFHKKIINEYLSKATSVKNPTVTLMMGAPAVGKGTVRNFLSEKNSDIFGDVIMDPDNIKMKDLKEDYNAYLKHDKKTAAAKIHEESSYIGKQIIKALINKKANFTIDKVFYDYDNLSKQIDQLKKGGYKINLIYVSCDKNIAYKRMLERGEKTDRFVPYNYFIIAHNTIRKTFNKIKNDSRLNKIMHYTTNVKEGESPLLLPN